MCRGNLVAARKVTTKKLWQNDRVFSSELHAYPIGGGIVATYHFQFVFMLPYLGIKRTHDDSKLLPQQSYLSILELLTDGTGIDV